MYEHKSCQVSMDSSFLAAQISEILSVYLILATVARGTDDYEYS